MGTFHSIIPSFHHSSECYLYVTWNVACSSHIMRTILFNIPKQITLQLHTNTRNTHQICKTTHILSLRLSFQFHNNTFLQTTTHTSLCNTHTHLILISFFKHNLSKHPLTHTHTNTHCSTEHQSITALE